MAISAIHLWGDSLAKGVVFDDARGRYCITPDRFVLRLEESLGMPVINHARMGAIVTEGYADFLQTAPEPGNLVVIEYGGNDCDMPWKDVAENPEGLYEGRLPIEEFTNTLRQFVDAVRARGMLPLLVTPTPLEAQRYFDWVTKGISQERVLQFLGDVQHIYRWQERYSIAIRTVAIEKDCVLFDMRDVFLATRRYPELFCIDGIHPNAQGHALIAESVLAQKDRLATALYARETSPA